MIRLIIFLILFSASFSQIIIGEGMNGQELLNYVVDHYKTSTTLGYGNARDVLYGIIDLREDNQLSCVYSGFTITLDVTQDPSTNAYNQGINCEHTWPQSMGASQEPQKSDMHHLYPCKSNVNSSRGNHPYTDIIDTETDTWYRNDYSQNTVPNEFIDQYAEKLNGATPVFEPREDHKGNASRAMFYFYAMYQQAADSTFWDTQKNTLFEWHSIDPIDQEELDRTWLISSYQEGHPNPFIIDSSLARRIWLTDHVGGGSPPDSFSLIYPALGMEISTVYPEFIWHTSNDEDNMDIVTYKLIFDTPEPGIFVYDVAFDTSFTLTDPLPDNCQIYWQVIAEDLEGNQTVSQGEYQIFYTNEENENPSTPILIAPINGSTQSTLTPHFYWTESLDPDPLDQVIYIMLLEENNLGTWFDFNADSNWFIPELNLIDNSMFKWLVHSMDSNGSNSYSDSSVFYTDEFPESPGSFSTVYPPDQFVHDQSEIEFIWNRPFDPDPIETLHYQVIYTTNYEDWLSLTNYISSEIIEEDTSIILQLENNSRYFWGVKVTDSDGFFLLGNDSLPQELIIGNLKINEISPPSKFSLHQNYPNPFNPVTKIKYDISKQGNVSLSIYDIKGYNLISLVNKQQDAGSYSVIWDGKNKFGHILPGGIYIYRINSGSFIDTKKLILLK
ncbi:endonuclease [Candidatus Marinimicrobia bacterium]|nr:endonuclease [Candidatus Neomarinimicrobiota bacterium]